MTTLCGTTTVGQNLTIQHFLKGIFQLDKTSINVKECVTVIIILYSAEEEGLSTDDEEERDDGSGAVLYIQMEFCEHRTLRELIDSGDFVRDRFRMWILFRQLVEGINYFHNMNIIHRDLKV